MGKPITIKNQIDQFLNGDRESVGVLIRHYYARLFVFCRTLLKTEEEIPDIIQNIFIKTWLSRNRIRNPEAFDSYLLTIAKNEIITLFRKKLREGNYRERIILSATSPEYLDYKEFEYRDYVEKVLELVEKLPEKRKLVYKLSREEGFSNRQIALELNISIKTVEDHLTQAVRFIRKNSSPDFD